MLARSVLRQIRNSLGRYLAIFAIIALGVGFFAGLRVSTDAMLETADGYFREMGLYDFRLVSTLGFTAEDVEAFAGLEGVKTALGSVNADFLCAGSEGDMVFRAHLLTEEMNRVDLVAGRLPRSGGECVLDAKYFGEESIGVVLTLSEENTEETFNTFAYDAFTVVGLVNAPYYANFERGTTALGRGSLAGFVCLPAEGFRTDYFTEIFLSLGDLGNSSSQEYEDAVREMEPSVSALLEERAALRYNALRDEALSKIEDAQRELDEGRETYFSLRADAKKELTDARQELDSARSGLDEGWQQLAEGRKTLDAQKADAEKRFDDARRELDEGWAQLERARMELLSQRESLEQELTDAQAELEEASRQLTQGEEQLAQCRNLYQAGQALVLGLSGAGLIDPAVSPEELVSALLSGGSPRLTAAADHALAEYGMSSKGFCDAWILAGEQLGMPLTEEAMAALTAELEVARTKYDDGTARLEAERSAAEAAMAEAEEQLEETEAQLSAGEKEYAESFEAAYAAIAEAEQELSDGELRLSEGEAEYADGLLEYENAAAEAEQKFAEAEAELAEGQQRVDEAREKLGDLEEPVTFVLDRSANIGCATLDNDMGIVRGVSRVFPLFFFLVAALVCVTTMTRMVDEQRTQNGVLKALGYGSGAIIGQYLFYAGSASALGCVTGFLLGSRFLPMALWQVYQIMYSVARPVAFVLDWGLFAACTALFLLCALGATWLVCRRDLRESAAELIRPKAPSAGKRILIERVKFLWKRVKFLHKVSIRNILRYKKRMVMMILGVGGCTALLLTGFGIRDSIQHIVDYQYDEIELYDCSVTFTKALSMTEQERFRSAHEEEISSVAFLHAGAMDLTEGGRTVSVNALVFEEPLEGFFDLHRNGEPVPWPGFGETVINNRLAADCGLRTGDTITLRSPELREVTLTVSGIFDNYIYDYAFIRTDTLREQWGASPEIKTAYLNLAEGAEGHAVAASVMGDGNAAAVNVLNDMRQRVGSMLSSMNYIVLIVLVCAGALAFIVLYNLTNISINERKREIATLKVLGFYPKETAAYVFRENMVLTLISALAGLPMGYALLWYVMNQIKISSFYFGCRAAPFSYVVSVALTFVFAAIVAFLLYFKLDKIDMADSLKAIE